MFIKIYYGKAIRIFERFLNFGYSWMKRMKTFDAKITVFKWRKLTIGVRQIYN